MSEVKIGIQLIIFNNKERKDLDGVLKDCKERGYDCVETVLLFDTYSPRQLQETCKEHELEYAAIHGGFDNFREKVSVDKLIKNSVDVGAKYLICSGVGKSKGLDGFKEAVPVFNYVGERCKEAGLIFCYHNHSFEFEEFNGVKGIHFLGKETDPELVKFNMDIAWVHIGGERPEEFIERYKDRCGYYHFKDAMIKGSLPITNWEAIKEAVTWTALGKGVVDLKSAYETAVKYNPKYIIYEQDVAQISALQDIAQSRNYLKTLGLLAKTSKRP